MEDKRLEKIVTIDADLHRELKILAAKKGKTLRKLVETAIEAWLRSEPRENPYMPGGRPFGLKEPEDQEKRDGNA